MSLIGLVSFSLLVIKFSFVSWSQLVREVVISSASSFLNSWNGNIGAITITKVNALFETDSLTFASKGYLTSVD